MAHVAGTAGQLAWADGVDVDVAALQAVTDGIQRGALSATAIVGTTTTAVVYPTPYAGGVTPVVVACMNATVVSGRGIGVSGITNTGFNIVLLSTSTTAVPVTWIAVAP
jgi:hypothetical protein